ncbi:unnamed protein product [Lymnaea stagnalis]|uniref:Adipose-secreted signaling protein n=1 Tax=Lymnaea stagnalis TaxID=6523 RepID=A0AAV2H6N4_LYMST
MAEPAAHKDETIDTHSEHPHHHHQSHHAHFLIPQDQDDLSAHDSKILFEALSENSVNVRLGFLQYKHVYEVHFSIEHELGKEINFNALDSLNAKIDSAKPSENGQGHDIVLVFSAVKEKLMQESITLTSKENPSKILTLVFHARVLGKGKGTPSLKKGIHCIRVEWDEESDASDWQGF